MEMSEKLQKTPQASPIAPPTSSERRESLVKLRMDLLFFKMAIQVPKVMMENLPNLLVVMILLVLILMTHPHFLTLPLLLFNSDKFWIRAPQELCLKLWTQELCLKL